MNIPFSSPRQQPKDAILDCVTQTAGNTPLVRLNRIVSRYNIEADLLAKLEYFNPAGSIKDRSALAMFDSLAKKQDLPLAHVIEASSGNSGVACAWLGALNGVDVTIVMPENMSQERQKLITHYGANLIKTPRADGMPGAIQRAEEMLAAIPGAVSMDQFNNPANAQAHEHTTSKEIWRDTAGNVDAVIAGMGTGGTLTGIGRHLKSLNPAVKIIAVEPETCPLLSAGKSGPHLIQGINPGHIPEGLDRSVIDHVIPVADEEAIAMAQQLARTEGLAVGMSSGAVLAGAIKLVAQQCSFRYKRVVLIMADGAERYFSTELFTR